MREIYDGLTQGQYTWENTSWTENYGYLKYGDASSDQYVASQAHWFSKREILDALKNGHFDGLAFDTGGYTGKWDSTGRLAMLH
jgi:hypothetical protein